MSQKQVESVQKEKRYAVVEVHAQKNTIGATPDHEPSNNDRPEGAQYAHISIYVVLVRFVVA